MKRQRNFAKKRKANNLVAIETSIAKKRKKIIETKFKKKVWGLL